MRANNQAPLLGELLPSWVVSLRARNRSPRTIDSYLLAARQLITWLEGEELSTRVDEITHRHLNGFLAQIRETRAPATAKQRYASLLQLFEWLTIEEEIPANPMAGRKVRPPDVPAQPIAVIEEEDLSRLLASVGGSSFEDRRDAAVLYLLADTGIRLGELAALQTSDLADLASGMAIVRGKGARMRAVPFSRKTAQAIDRYVRARARHEHARSPWLWLGLKGRVSGSGLAQMVKRRGAAVGIEGLHPHRFRHTFAHMWLAAGGQEGDLQRIAGWADRQMLNRYGASTAHQRALDAHQRFSPIERLQ
ncbi:MAG: tyrosine-type recombinase/integrase [Acidimicrobiia bacterium]